MSEKQEVVAEAPAPVAPALPMPVATRSFANDQWDMWVDGQLPNGNRAVCAIKFADGSVFEVGSGWQKTQ